MSGSKKLVIVESPAKAKTIAQYLGDGYEVHASVGHIRDLVEPRAELIFGLDYPRWLSLWRLLRRTLARVITRQQLCNGNVENWRALVSRESIILWHFTSFAGKRRQLRQWAACPEGAPVLVLRHPRELDLLLRLLGTE